MMLKKYLGLLFFSCLTLTINGRAQGIQNSDKNNYLISSFNEYLKSVHLDRLVKATDFSFQQTITLPGKTGNNILASKFRLLLQPVSSLEKPLNFNENWNKLLDQTKGKTDIYRELFLQLCNFSGISPDSLALSITSKRPDIFSVLVYFSDEIRTEKLLAEGRGNVQTQFRLEPGDLNNGLLGMVFETAPFTNNRTEKLTGAIYRFLKMPLESQKNGRVDVNIKRWGTGLFQFTATNIKGRITGKYHELIKVNLAIIRSPNQKTADIAVHFTIYLSSAPIIAENAEEYENALREYKGGVANFGATLREVIKNSIYAKNL